MPLGLTSSSRSDRRGRARRHSLGQHYLTDPSVVGSMVRLAGIRRDERVLEIGTGRGALTKEVTGLTANLEGYEIDRESYEGLKAELEG
ncbi:MAG TPA: rRNA adenine N-6-methyltransferase family protein, partial [Spirochaetia bacterium]|nr:rRNA adenine N-6-methyltransferase family protein [Spirochaetia bacterium]